MATRFREFKPIEINLPVPPVGNKIFCTGQHGLYILERGPGIWRVLACTHSGSGGFQVYDGLPDKHGHFPDEQMPMDDPGYAKRNGRRLLKAMPAVMGMWMFDGGFHHGLTLKSEGELSVAAPFLTITWMPKQEPKRTIVN